MAAFSLPRAGGDGADGRLTVSTAGGSLEENVLRWRSQFGEKPDKESREEVEMAQVKVTLVDFSGTFADQPRAFAPPERREGYRMLGAIIPVDGRLCFVKGYGPEKTMAARADEFRALVRSLKSSSAAE